MMKKLFIIAIFTALSLSAWAQDCEVTVFGTCYYTSFGTRTASGDRINAAKVKSGEHRWVALSRDLYNMGYRFNDTIVVKSDKCEFMNGLWVVKDKMARTRRIDFLIHKEQRSQFHNGSVVIRKYTAADRGLFDEKGHFIKNQLLTGPADVQKEDITAIKQD